MYLMGIRLWSIITLKGMRKFFRKLVAKLCSHCIEKQLVSFGLYLLSEERENLIKNHPDFGASPHVNRQRVVFDADLANWRANK